MAQYQHNKHHSNIQRIVILHASQSGTSEYFAQQLHSQLQTSSSQISIVDKDSIECYSIDNYYQQTEGYFCTTSLSIYLLLVQVLKDHLQIP